MLIYVSINLLCGGIFLFVTACSNTDPYFNLAMEEYFLSHRAEEFVLLWRNAPSIIVGRNQITENEINVDFVRANALPAVRRLTGGGAVYHDLGNINFSFITNGADFSSCPALCAPILEFLHSLGVNAEFSGRNDITVCGKKISGTARCIKNGRLLFHGTLLFNADLAAMGEALKVQKKKLIGNGVQSVRGRVANITEYLSERMSADDFYKYLEQYISDGNSRYELTARDKAQINAIRDSRYIKDEWNYGGGHAVLTRLPCGSIGIEKTVSGGIIEQLRIRGDFIGLRDISSLEQRLTGIPCSASAVSAALHGEDISQYVCGITQDELIKIITEG